MAIKQQLKGRGPQVLHSWSSQLVSFMKYFWWPTGPRLRTLPRNSMLEIWKKLSSLVLLREGLVFFNGSLTTASLNMLKPNVPTIRHLPLPPPTQSVHLWPLLLTKLSNVKHTGHCPYFSSNPFCIQPNGTCKCQWGIYQYCSNRNLYIYTLSVPSAK